MPQTFVALQCSFCEAFQVTLDKASKKFSCAICSQKQSFKMIHAISNSAKDCRKVVQELNELRGARDRQLGSEETAAALEHVVAAAAGCPASDALEQAFDWEEFADPTDNAGIDEDDSWPAGTGDFVTTLPDSSAARGRRGKRRGLVVATADDAQYKQPHYQQGPGKQQQQQPQGHEAAAPGAGSSLVSCRLPAKLQRVASQPLHQQQLRATPSQQHQQQPWQPQQQQTDPTYQQQTASAQQQQDVRGQWGSRATPVDSASARAVPTSSSAGGCGVAWLQPQPGEQRGWRPAGNHPQQQHIQQHVPQMQQEQQQQLRLEPPLSITAAMVNQQPQQGGQSYSSGSHSRAQLQPQQRQQLQPQHLPNSGAGKAVLQPTPAAAGGGAWGAFVDDDGQGAGSSEEDECIVDGQGACCLGFTGLEACRLQGTAAAAAASHGSAAAARWS